MFNKRPRKEGHTQEEIEILLQTKKDLQIAIEENRILNADTADGYKQKLHVVQEILEKEGIDDDSVIIPYGGQQFAGGDLKDMDSDELLRIQTIQLNKLLIAFQKYEQATNKSDKSQEYLLYYVKKIYKNVLFWFVLTIISIFIFVIFFLNQLN